jgi:CheY-like chemotaxis protein
MATVLIIDDVEEIRENLLEYLELKGFKVDTAQNGEEGIALLKKKPFDLVLCDVKMPKVNGFEVLTHLRAVPETQKVPFVFLSASAQKEEIEKGLLSAADAYLTKPFSFTDLDLIIKDCLKR